MKKVWLISIAAMTAFLQAGPTAGAQTGGAPPLTSGVEERMMVLASNTVELDVTMEVIDEDMDSSSDVINIIEIPVQRLQRERHQEQLNRDLSERSGDRGIGNRETADGFQGGGNRPGGDGLTGEQGRTERPGPRPEISERPADIDARETIDNVSRPERDDSMGNRNEIPEPARPETGRPEMERNEMPETHRPAEVDRGEMPQIKQEIHNAVQEKKENVSPAKGR